MTAIAVITTVATLEEARRIGAELVERRLAACAQISAIESFYRWRGSVQHDDEYRLLLKTTEERYAAVAAVIKELHSYELPAVHSLRFEYLDPAYGAWIEESSRGA